MTEQLTKVFAALADPTRRDIVARLAAGDATVDQPRRAVRRVAAGGLQAPEGARGRRAGQPSREAQRRPVHLEAEVLDLMTMWIERYRRQAEERYQRLDAVLAELDENEPLHRQTTDEGRAS